MILVATCVDNLHILKQPDVPSPQISQNPGNQLLANQNLL